VPGAGFLPGPGPGAPGPDGNGPTPGFVPAVAIDGVPYHYWFEADYLLWFLSKDHLPPLLTAGTLQSGGILGQPGTTVLVGGDSLDHDQRSGARFTIGGWVTDYHGFGLEISYFILEGTSKSFSTSGTGAAGTPVIGRPFFNILSGREDVFAVAIPG